MNILMVLTSHDALADTGKKTGFWLEEFAAPYCVLSGAEADAVHLVFFRSCRQKYRHFPRGRTSERGHSSKDTARIRRLAVRRPHASLRARSGRIS